MPLQAPVFSTKLQEKGYADKYRGLDQPIYLIGVEFSKDTRNITAFEYERATDPYYGSELAELDENVPRQR